jgi:hypothetical protein
LQKGYIERVSFGASGDTPNDIFLIRLPEGIAFAGVNRAYQSSADSNAGMIMALEPYPHFMDAAEISALAATMRAHLNWSASSAYRFVKQYAPQTEQRFEEMLQFKRVGNNPNTMPLISVSRIFRRNLKHEEKSLVEEEIYIDTKGGGKILNTRKGRLWI